MSRLNRFFLLALLTALLAAALCLTQPAQAARADWPPPPPHGGSLYPPEGGTRVQLVSETVQIEAAANRADRVPYAVVDAAYVLRNNGAKEEALALRYPLSALGHYGADECQISAYQPLRNMAVWVEARLISYRIEYAVVPNTRAVQAWDPAEVTRACWASFTAAVPAGEEITVRLRFEQEAGVEGYPGYAVYPYALGPGAGWDGPVERAEIVFRAPWFLTEENLIEYTPRDGQVNMALTAQNTAGAKEIRWLREDFEPRKGDAVRVQIINPPVYQEINRGRMLYMHSRRGEAWGRYGLAAKRAILAEGGFRTGPLAARLYRESYDAYTRTLELYPWNGDWHAGFAELLCTNAAHPTFDLDWSEAERWAACDEQIQAALRYYPQQELALRLLEQYGADGRMRRQVPNSHETVAFPAVENLGMR